MAISDLGDLIIDVEVAVVGPDEVTVRVVVQVDYVFARAVPGAVRWHHGDGGRDRDRQPWLTPPLARGENPGFACHQNHCAVDDPCAEPGTGGGITCGVRVG